MADEPDYSTIKNESLIDLLKGIFEKDPEKRLTIFKIKDHKWLTNNGLEPMP